MPAHLGIASTATPTPEASKHIDTMFIVLMSIFVGPLALLLLVVIIVIIYAYSARGCVKLKAKIQRGLASRRAAQKHRRQEARASVGEHHDWDDGIELQAQQGLNKDEDEDWFGRNDRQSTKYEPVGRATGV